MLSFAEEILLLVLDDKKGTVLLDLPEGSLNYAISGAVLMDLAQKDRIDTDLHQLILVDKTPTGDDILDAVLEKIGLSKEPHPTKYWVETIAKDGNEIKERLFERLIEKGVLKKVEDKFLWVFDVRRYPVIDDKEQREVKRRVLDVLLSDEIPDPRDIVIICLADACMLFDKILSRRELKSVSDRIAQIAKMDLIGQAVSNTIRELQISIAQASPYFC
jgi:hypothetical protein